MKLIDADMLCNYCDNNINHSITPNEIMRMPFIEAEPVKHAYWIDLSEKYTDCLAYISIDGTLEIVKHFKCSSCGNKEMVKSDYCRRCGAKMDGGADNA